MHNALTESAATHYAIARAIREPGESFTVWRGLSLYYVRPSKAEKPPAADLVCIAQQWDKKTVQLRYAGARSEFVAA
jgi:hypothetical protein